MARRRSENGSGTIIQHNGRAKEFQIVFTVDGKRKSGGYYKTRAEASAALRDYTTSVDKGEYVEPQKMSLSEWLQIWVDEYCCDIKDSTRIQYRGYIKNHINPVLGEISLCNLQPHMIQRFINRLEYQGKKKSKTISYKTRKNIHGCLSAALQRAVKIRYLKENPATGCTIPRDDEDVNNQGICPLNTSQIIQFTKAIKGARFERIYLIALYTGMRMSEILGLQWDRVNLETGELVISKQLAMKREKGSTRRLTSPKSRKVRSIIIPQTAVDILRSQQRTQYQYRLLAGPEWNNELSLVFTNEYGQPLPHASIEHEFKKIMISMKLPERRFHDLRHTFATEAIRAGVDVETVSKALGHFSVGFTLDVYGHVTQEMKEEAARRIQLSIDKRAYG